MRSSNLNLLTNPRKLFFYLVALTFFGVVTILVLYIEGAPTIIIPISIVFLIVLEILFKYRMRKKLKKMNTYKSTVMFSFYIYDRLSSLYSIGILLICIQQDIPYLTVVLLPKYLSFIGLLFKETLQRVIFDSEPIFRILAIIYRTGLYLTYITLSLRFDRAISTAWETSFWPVWLIIAVSFGMSLLLVIMFFFQLADKLFYKKGTWGECRVLVLVILYTLIQGCATLGGYLIAQKSIREEKPSIYLVYFGLFFVAGILFLGVLTAILKGDIEAFLIELYSFEKTSVQIRQMEQAQIDRDNAQPQQEIEEVEEGSHSSNIQSIKIQKKKPERLPIPQYLVQMSSQYFVKATKKDIFFKKMETRQKQIEKSQKKRAKFNKGKDVLNGLNPDPNGLNGINGQVKNKIIPLDNQKLKSEIEKIKKKNHKKSLSGIRRPKTRPSGLFKKVEDHQETKPTEPNIDMDDSIFESSFSESSKYNPQDVLKFFKDPKMHENSSYLQSSQLEESEVQDKTQNQKPKKSKKIEIEKIRNSSYKPISISSKYLKPTTNHLQRTGIGKQQFNKLF